MPFGKVYNTEMTRCYQSFTLSLHNKGYAHVVLIRFCH